MSLLGAIPAGIAAMGGSSGGGGFLGGLLNVAPAILGAVGDLGGAALSGKFNAAEAAKQREWQERMSNTQYQRAADDLEAAGLNRVLALGNPAGVPGGAVGSMPGSSPGSAVIAGYNASVAASSARQAIEQSKAQEKYIEAQTRLTNADAAQKEKLMPVYEGVNDVLEFLDKKLRSSVKDPSGVVDNVLNSARSALTDTFENVDIEYKRAKEYVREKRKDVSDWLKSKRNPNFNFRD